MGFLRGREKNALAEQVFNYLYEEVANGNFQHDYLTYKHGAGGIWDRWEICDSSWAPGCKFQVYKSPKSVNIELEDRILRWKHRRQLGKALRALQNRSELDKFEQALKAIHGGAPTPVLDAPSEREVKKALKDVKTWVHEKR